MAAPSVLPFGLAALGEIKALLQAKRWAELRDLMDLPTVWVWDRPLPGPEFHDALAAILEPAIDVHLLVLAALRRDQRQGTTRASYTCCVLWAYPGSWEEHDLEFDIHLGYSGGETLPFTVDYLGFTAPTPEVIPFPEDDASDGRPRGMARARRRHLRPPILMPEPEVSANGAGRAESGTHTESESNVARRR